MSGSLFAGAGTLFRKEVLRFWKVAFQTVAAPVLTAVLYLLIFSHVLENRVQVYGQLSYTAFLVPGLVMMSVLQNAFANSSSSLVQSKIMGNLVFLLLTPLSHWSWFFAYVGSSVVRGLLVGTGVFIATAFFATPVFVAGVFYSIHSLPAFWQGVSHLNPFFYMIDGFRFGFFGVSDVSPWLSLGIVGSSLLVISGIAVQLLRTGYKIRG